MKKFQLTIMAIFMCLIGANAADIIILNNGTRIDAKITEVSSAEVKYKEISNLDGPAFVLATDQLLTIIYENGNVQTYGNNSKQQSAGNAQKEPAQAEQASDGQNQKKNTIQFNPQPSDKYRFGLTLGYVSKNIKAGSPAIQGSFLGGIVGAVSPAIRFGFLANPTFKYGIGLRTGLYVEYAVEKDKLSNTKKTSSSNRTKYYHDITASIPLQVSYRYELIPNLSFMFYTGPVFDFGLITLTSYTGVEGADFYSKYYRDVYNGFNALWGVGAGVQWKRWRLDVGGEFGMVNKTDKTVDVIGNWNKPVYATITCMF